MLDSDFAQIAAILLVAAAAGGLAQMLRQPLIVAYIAVGVLVGPAALGLITATEQVALLAEVGIAVLLFLVGLKLDLHLIRATGAVALVTGMAQIVLTAGAGYLIATALGYGGITALYVALAVTFSSTIIIVKLLSDKRELDELHGRIAVGLLIVQDLVVILAMIVVTSLTQGSDRAVTGEMASTVARGLVLLAVVALLARYVLPRLLDRMAQTPELIVLFGLAWGVAVAALTDWQGLSMEVGAFVAGVSLASTSYREALGARLVSLRDVLILFFFIDLGSTMDLEEAAQQIGPALVLSAFVLIAKPLIVMAVMGLLGYRRRVFAQTGLVTGQISEFSLILVALGLGVGHVQSSTVGLVTMVAVITIGLSTYQILYSKQILRWIAPVLSVLERAVPTRGLDPSGGTAPYDAIVIGGGRFGGALLSGLASRPRRLLVVDLNPHVLAAWRAEGVETLYGDIAEPELVPTLPLDQARAVICTVPELSVNLTLLASLRREGFSGTIALTALSEHHAEVLSDEDGVTVLRPFAAAADHSLPRLFAESRPEP